MKVFIIWSGNRSKTIATALREWIPGIIQRVKPWVSELDVEAGARWNKEIADALEQTRFGVICLTRDNCIAPWLLFEAGALAKTIRETFVCPYLIDMEPSEIPQGPLVQFQAKKADKNGTKELIFTINNSLKEYALDERQLEKAFELWWPDLESTLDNLPKEPTETPKRSLEDMVEEILEHVRKLYQSSSDAEVARRASEVLLRFILGSEYDDAMKTKERWKDNLTREQLQKLGNKIRKMSLEKITTNDSEDDLSDTDKYGRMK